MTNPSDVSTSFGIFHGHLSRSGIEKSPFIVFLHGFPDDHRIWEFQLEELKEIADLWSPDLYSHSFKNQVQGLLEVIKRERGDRNVIIVAHDMGGPVACELVRQAPDLINKLLLINTFSIEHFIHLCAQSMLLLKSIYMPFFSGPLHRTDWWKVMAKRFIKLVYDKGGIPSDDPILKSLNSEVVEGIKRYREIGKELPKHFVFSPKPLEVETHFLFGVDDPFLVIPKEKDLSRYYRLSSLDFYFTGHWPQRTYASDVTRKIRELI